MWAGVGEVNRQNKRHRRRAQALPSLPHPLGRHSPADGAGETGASQTSEPPCHPQPAGETRSRPSRAALPLLGCFSSTLDSQCPDSFPSTFARLNSFPGPKGQPTHPPPSENAPPKDASPFPYSFLSITAQHPAAHPDCPRPPGSINCICRKCEVCKATLSGDDWTEEFVRAPERRGHA